MPAVAGIKRIISGKLALSKLRGKAFVRAMYKAFDAEDNSAAKKYSGKKK